MIRFIVLISRRSVIVKKIPKHHMIDFRDFPKDFPWIIFHVYLFCLSQIHKNPLAHVRSYSITELSKITFNSNLSSQEWKSKKSSSPQSIVKPCINHLNPNLFRAQPGLRFPSHCISNRNEKLPFFIFLISTCDKRIRKLSHNFSLRTILATGNTTRRWAKAWKTKKKKRFSGNSFHLEKC